MQKFQSSTNPAERKAAWSEIQRLFYEDVVAIKAGDYYEYYVLQKKVQGFSGIDYPPYWNIWLEG
jgi:ABC-type transport system substrate-binding protein